MAKKKGTMPMATMPIPTEIPLRRSGIFLPLLLGLCLLIATGCAEETHEEGHAASDSHGAEDSWSVTAWGSLYEVFPEIDALVAGEAASAHTHVTILEGFAALGEGRVEIVLTGSDGAEEVFSSAESAKPGIYNIEVKPRTTGEYELLFRIESVAGTETIRGGQVRVGSHDSPGAVLRAPAPRGATSGGEPVPFLKEQQWQTLFATDWVRTGALPRSLEGLAVVRPTAGGEAWITAPMDGVVVAQPWPFVGQAVETGDVLFRLAPRVSPGRSLAELTADLEAARQEAGSAERRQARLEELFAVEATSAREVDEARTRVGVAQARMSAAEADLGAARAARQGRGGGDPLLVVAPFAGQVAAVEASPGAGASAGERLARLVRTDKVWLSVAVPPEAGARLSEGVSGVVLGGALRFGSEATRLVAVAPSVDPATGKLEVLVEVSGAAVPLGSTWNAQVLLTGADEGIVVPTSALVDDGGQPVVFLQLGGESFVRQPVEVIARQGDRALVGGLVPGQRLVSRGGESIRRSSLMSSGVAHGHVH